MGSYEISPNLYIMFIGPAGGPRKTTTVQYAEELLEEIGDVTKAPELVTKESLFSTIVKAPDNSMCIIAPEFGEFIVKSGPEMYGFLTNAYDGKRRLAGSTISRGAEIANRPCVNLLGATTPEWVAENMPESVIGGGYASRVIFIYEETVRRRKLFFDKLEEEVGLSEEQIQEMRLNLQHDLLHIAENLAGEISLTPEARDYMENWYVNNANIPQNTEYKVQGFLNRRPTHVLKLAIIHHIAYSDELLVNLVDIKTAIDIVLDIEKGLSQTFSAVGKNPYTVDIKRILSFITEKGKVSEQDIKRNFYHVALPEKLDALISSLMQAGYVKVISDTSDNNARYFIVAPKKTAVKDINLASPTAKP